MWSGSRDPFLLARLYASVIRAVTVCRPLCLSVCLSQVGVLPWRLNLRSRKQRCRPTIAHGLQFSDAKALDEMPTALFPTGAPNRSGVGQKRRFSTNISLSQKRCKIGTELLRNANRNSYALCRMALFPETLGDHCTNYPKPPHFPHFVSPFIYSAWVEIEPVNRQV